MQNILLIILLFLVLIVIFTLFRRRDIGTEEKITVMMERLNQLNEQNYALRQELDNKLSLTHQATREHFNQTTNFLQNQNQTIYQIISEVTEKLTKLDETNKQVINFSNQLQNLQDILRNPKQRGVLGEYFLEETLKNVLSPRSYQMQYSFKDGTIVDAVIFVKNKIIPIDSKFSLENYERLLNTNNPEIREKLEKTFKQDLKVRIDETSKYIKPEENTMEFAFMFIPSEAIYYDLLVNKVGTIKVDTQDLIEYAFKEKKVIIVSPTSFLAYLQTVLQGLRAMQIEESTKEIMINIQKLGKHLIAYDDFMKRLGNSMSTTVNHYNNAYKEFKKIDKDIAKISKSESVIDPLILEKPKIEN